jgi:predicted CoA-substrate-specific enzyme activase
VDVGTECVKAVVVDKDGRVLGRAVALARGYFEACAHEVLAAALDDAQRRREELEGIGATGFGMQCVSGATLLLAEAAAHALGAFHAFARPMTLLSIGGRDPQVITVDAEGRRVAARGVRRCATGVGSFLMFAARHLDVNPAQLQELAAAADGHGARVSSYCSVLSTSDVLERLREGVPREEIALACIRSIAERVVEIGGLEPPLFACGGVAEYFPGVPHAIERLSGTEVRAVAEPIFTAALGVALKTALRAHVA